MIVWIEKLALAPVFMIGSEKAVNIYYLKSPSEKRERAAFSCPTGTEL